MATKGDLGVTAYAASKAGLIGAYTLVHQNRSSFLHGNMATLVLPPPILFVHVYSSSLTCAF